MNTSHASVSVVIPTYNRPETLKRAIASVFCQTYEIKEIIVVINGINTDTVALMEEIMKNNDNVRIHICERNMGANYARNIGVNMAKGEFVAFLDDDDEWLPDKVAKQMAVFAHDPEIGIVCTGIMHMFTEEGVKYKFIPEPERDSSRRILVKNCIGSTTTVIARKSVIVDAGMFDECLPAKQDYDMWIRMCQICKVGVVKEACVNYYHSQRNAQISHDCKKHIAADRILSEKYRVLFDALTSKEKTAKKQYELLCIAKRGIHGRDRKTALKYAIRAAKCKVSSQVMFCMVAAIMPYSAVLKAYSCRKR